MGLLQQEPRVVDQGLRGPAEDPLERVADVEVARRVHLPQDDGDIEALDEGADLTVVQRVDRLGHQLAEPRDVGQITGPSQMEALQPGHVEALQRLQLARVLDAFGDDLSVHIVGERHEGPGQCSAYGVLVDVPGE